MTHIRIRFVHLGGHVHCRVFSAKAPDLTHGKNGDLVFDEQEWRDGLKDALTRIAEVIPESRCSDG